MCYIAKTGARKEQDRNLSQNLWRKKIRNKTQKAGEWVQVRAPPKVQVKVENG